jgi:hypothetical protein
MVFDTEWEHAEIRKEIEAMNERQIARGKELKAMSNADFIALWEGYRYMTPNELNAIEPFYVVVAIEKLKATTKGI